MEKKCQTKGCKRTFISISFSSKKQTMCDACAMKRLGHKKYITK